MNPVVEERGEEVAQRPETRRQLSLHQRLPELLLILVLIVAGYLRFSGLNWDEFAHLHPDERFLTMVESSISPPQSLTEYFNTSESPLNPHNAGHRFFVYGTLPIFIVRYLAEWLGQTGYDEVHLVGRATSASFDLVSLVLIYLIGARLYSRRVGLLASALAGLSVLLIQHAHYFVVDPIANTFILAGFYFAVRVSQNQATVDYALFGVALGMATASKISAAPLAGLLVLAAWAPFWRSWEEGISLFRSRTLGRLMLAAGIALLTFRIFQPYAFMGPSFLDVRLNPDWLSNMAEIRRQSSGLVDFPPALQWADRTPILFSLKNLVLWGMGFPLGALAWTGWAWALVRMLRGEWIRHQLPVLWTGAYFIWQSFGFTSAMRYQLPVYPTLTILSAWALWEAWHWASSRSIDRRRWARISIGGLGALVLLATAGYAFAFSGIYTRPVTRVEASRWIYTHVPGPINLVIRSSGETLLEPIPLPSGLTLTEDEPFVTSFVSRQGGAVESVLLPYASLHPTGRQSVELEISVREAEGNPETIGRALFSGSLSPSSEEVRIEAQFEELLTIAPGQALELRLNLRDGERVSLRGSIIISETGWDDGLPLRLEGRDGYGGFYQGVNQELYWPDDQDDDGNGVSDKLERIVETLSKADYLAISSNRQYGSIARVPERYPLTTAYYRLLLDCPEPQSVSRCAARAQPGSVQNDFGYELVAVFESNPTLGPIQISDQGAEEAFTVYDHPKVLIFSKTDQFSAEALAGALRSVDLSRVENRLPKDLGASSKTLMLPLERWQEAVASGTWSDLFDRSSLINRSESFAVLVWWLFLSALGLAAFPIVRIAFSGLQDKGYPLAKMVGLLLLAWGSWMLGSFQVPFGAPTIAVVLLAIASVSGVLAWRDRKDLAAFLRRERNQILWIELLALSLFLLDLFIRFGNPDLWHPSKGGEKPMDFSYLNAVLKSTSFPPYDPWYAGGYINYYYYGFVLVGAPIKLLGLIPSTAYNLIIPTLFALLGLAGYSIGTNLLRRFSGERPGSTRGDPWLAGMASAVGLVLLGNLGTFRLLYDSLKQLGSTPETPLGGFASGFVSALRGLGRMITVEQRLPIGLDAWYWNPSRSIPPGPGEAGPITEFPFFTFLYADLHAHMIALPLTVLGLAWALSWLLASERTGTRARPIFHSAISLAIGGVIYGALRATNTWDFPVYLALGALAAILGGWLRFRKLSTRAVLDSSVAAIALVLLAVLLYQPYASWYGQGYTTADLWQGSRTSVDAFLTVHGLFLFVLLTWLIWESREWMARTPLSSLSRLRSRQSLLVVAALVFLAGIGLLMAMGARITILVLPMIAWAGLLFLRPGMPVEKRFVLALTGIALAITLVVELVVVTGDISRMNTVFKFYLQVWTMLSLASGAALAWLWADRAYWSAAWRQGWGIGFGALVFAAALYPLTASPAKIRDRISVAAPSTLDGMAYMAYATHFDLGEPIELSEDYRAIQWMQDNVEGSPVIVEANIPEYRWGTRFTIYTGLPGVLGWNWHQRQQRVVAPDADVMGRAIEISEFYSTPSAEKARDFLQKYDVRYVVVGQLERLYYGQVSPCRPDAAPTGGVTCDMTGRPIGMNSPDVLASECEPLDASAPGGDLACPTLGLDKFERLAADGYLGVAYEDTGTVIYEVLR